MFNELGWTRKDFEEYWASDGRKQYSVEVGIAIREGDTQKVVDLMEAETVRLGGLSTRQKAELAVRRLQERAEV